MSSWTVPGYAHIRELGRNASGRTVLGHHAATGVRVAIRYLAEDVRHDEAQRHRYRAEARLLAELDSPHVAGLYEYVEADHAVATVREYVDGVSLRVLLAGQGALDPEPALSILKGALLGLIAGHTVGAVHGDCKPENVLVDVLGHTKLSDFGGSATPGSAAADVSALVRLFLDCLGGQRDDAALALDRLPKRLRGLVPAFVGIGRTPPPGPDRDDAARPGESDRPGETLLVQVEGAARRAYGDGWEARGRKRLAQRVVRHASRLARRADSGR